MEDPDKFLGRGPLSLAPIHLFYFIPNWNLEFPKELSLLSSVFLFFDCRITLRNVSGNFNLSVWLPRKLRRDKK